MCRPGVTVPQFDQYPPAGWNWYRMMVTLDRRFKHAGFDVRNTIEPDRKLWVLNLHRDGQLAAAVLIEWEEHYPPGCFPES